MESVGEVVGSVTEAERVERPGELHIFEEARSFSRALAAGLGLDVRPIAVHRFPDGESLVRVQSGGAASAIVVRALDDPNAKLVELLFAADALRRCGVRELVLVAPYLGYMRQDRVFEPGQALSQHVVAGLLGRAFDEVVTIEAHLHRIHALSEVFPCRARSFSAAPAIARWCRSARADAVLVGPDAESEPWIRAIAHEADLPFRIGRKTRRGDTDVLVEMPPLPDDRGHAILVDDIASSGATLAAAAQSLRGRGARRVEAVVVHALFAPGAEDRIRSAGIEAVLSTDTIPHPSNAIAVADRVAEVLREPTRTGGEA